MVGEPHGIRHADEKRGEKILLAVAGNGDDGGGWIAVDEAAEQGEVVVFSAGERLESLPVGGGDMCGHRGYSLG